MKARQLLAQGVLLGALGGCVEAPPSRSEVLVDYKFYNMVDSAVVQIRVDGTVTRQNRLGPIETGAIDRAELDDLAQKIEAADLPTAEPRYGCGGCLDDAVHVVTSRVHGVVYRVESEAHTPHPDRLDPLFDALHDVSERPF